MGEHLMPLSAVEGYRRWAPSYDETANPVLALEERILEPLLRVGPGMRVLDAACGTGRWAERLARRGVYVWGIDLSPEMLAQASLKGEIANQCLAGDIRALPFREGFFDVALCSFALSYLPDIGKAVTEFARVARTVVVTDLHPEAMRRGWTRSFRDAGQTWQIDSFPYEVKQLEKAAADAGLVLDARVDARFGEPEREIFRAAGKERLFPTVSQCPAILITKWTR